MIHPEREYEPESIPVVEAGSESMPEPARQPESGPSDEVQKPISRILRKEIRKQRATAYNAAKRAGVSVDAVQRFLNGERGLTLSTVDKLAADLGLSLCTEEPAKSESIPTHD